MKKDLLEKINCLVNDISEEFEEDLNRRFPAINYEKNSNCGEIIIKGANTEFGDIRVYVGFKEIVVLLGNYFHTHFEIEASYKNILDNNSRQVICEVLEFIENIIRDKILLKIVKRGEKLVSASIVYDDEPIEYMAEISGLMSRIFTKKPKVIALYSWSGAKNIFITVLDRISK